MRSAAVRCSGGRFVRVFLLLNSGIPGRAIGHYLTNHSIVRGIGQISSTDLPEILGMINILVPQTWYRPIQLQIFGAYYSYQFQTKPRVNKWDDNVLITLGKVQSRYENRIFLDPIRRDAYGLPEIQVQFSYSPADWAIIEESAAALRNVASQIGLKLDLSAEGSDVCLFLPGADNHESGTCRMGRDPRTSVTNPVGSVHGITGLYITDNSVLPSMGAVNPTLSTVALAIRTADYIASECRLGQ
ncbi:Paromamine 6'-oxidase [compost metagenome]